MLVTLGPAPISGPWDVNGAAGCGLADGPAATVPHTDYHNPIGVLTYCCWWCLACGSPRPRRVDLLWHLRCCCCCFYPGPGFLSRSRLPAAVAFAFVLFLDSCWSRLGR